MEGGREEKEVRAERIPSSLTLILRTKTAKKSGTSTATPQEKIAMR